ncbi:hypothetical protein GP475_03415 [Corynebacterium poyangense]|uniref:Uncharacterized protein n=1 Tax=Corynebacterium poyangense TaxID=2684405 RepID=A0A7H0SS52_9CORY|nr:PPA1309 family protein [Corynebacterium poyangense]QNQ91377.1 hypothetical protein GP475_03415 [Corynebacterium poyangense]
MNPHGDADSPQALNRAMLEAVDFIHAEGWDAATPTLFALVRSELLGADFYHPDDDVSPLSLVVQDALPSHINHSSPELADYLSRTVWPKTISGIILSQEIRYRDASDATMTEPRPARLFSGVLRSGPELTLLQLKPTEEEVANEGPFAEDKVELRGGSEIAPEVIAALRYSLEQDPNFGDDS